MATSSVSKTIGASTNDAHENLGVVTTNATDRSIVSGYIGGWRFTSVTVPKNAPIVSAKLTVPVYACDPYHEIAGQAADNPGAFTAGVTSDLSGRPKTTARVNWIDSSVAEGNEQSPELKTIIQEIVNRSGWASGNALCLFATGLNGARSLYARFYDGSQYAQLDITYAVDEEITGGTGTVAVAGQAGSFDTIPPVDVNPGTGAVAVAGQPGSFDVLTIVEISPGTGAVEAAGQPGSFTVYEEPPPARNRLRVDLYSVAGVKLAVPPITECTADYEMAIDEVGSFSLTVPAVVESAASLTPGVQVRIYREGEGEVFRGVVRERGWVDGPNGDPMLTVSGPSVGDALVGANLLMGRPYEDDSLSTIANDLVSLASGWAVGTLGTPSNSTSSVSAEGASVFAALRQLAGRFRDADGAYHVRVNPTALTVDIDSFGAASGIRLAQLPAFDPGHAAAFPGIVPIGSVTVLEESWEVWNSLLPLGAGEGDAALSLEASTRTSPYTIQSKTAPDGRSLFYLEDTTSIATHGRRERVIADKHSVPITASAAGLEAAANALYDGAVAALLESKDPRYTYRVNVGPMPHVAAGSYRFRVGDTFRVTYRGRAEREDGSGYAYLDVDETLYLRRLRRRLGEDGGDAWMLDVGNSLGRRLDAAGRLAEYLESVWAIQVQPRIEADAPPTQPPVIGNPSSVLEYTIPVDLRRTNRLRQAIVTFEINQSGGGNWGGTIEINGVDRTAALGGTFATATEHTIDIRQYVSLFDVNEVKFSKATAFTIVSTTTIRGYRS